MRALGAFCSRKCPPTVPLAPVLRGDGRGEGRTGRGRRCLSAVSSCHFGALDDTSLSLSEGRGFAVRQGLCKRASEELNPILQFLRCQDRGVLDQSAHAVADGQFLLRRVDHPPVFSSLRSPAVRNAEEILIVREQYGSFPASVRQLLFIAPTQMAGIARGPSLHLPSPQAIGDGHGHAFVRVDPQSGHFLLPLVSLSTDCG